MIKSMTGFGKGQAVGKLGAISVEIRSLNHKYFDVVSRLPNQFLGFEDKVREYVKKKVKRGRINLSVTWEGKDGDRAAFVLDQHLARQYYRQLDKLKRELKLKDDVSISQLISLPEIIAHQHKKEDLAAVWPYLKKALDAALNELERMRQAEGKRLMRDLINRMGRIRLCLGGIETQLPKTIAAYKKNLLKKLKALSGIKKLNQDRLAEEIALFVRNGDVSEELTRIKSHLKAFKTALKTQKEAGKELDFIAQELFREANTVGAKSGSFKISRGVIKIKSQIEKMREQLQNVE